MRRSSPLLLFALLLGPACDRAEPEAPDGRAAPADSGPRAPAGARRACAAAPPAPRPAGGGFTLEPAGSLSGPRTGFVLARSGERVLAVGGEAPGLEPVYTVEAFDPATGRWQQAPPLSQARVGHSAVELEGGGVLVLGGRGPSGLVAPAELLEPETGRPEPAGELGEPRTGAAAVRLPGGRVLVAGGLGPDGALASVEIWEPSTRRFSAGPPLPAPRHDAVALVGPRCGVHVVGGRAGDRIFGVASLEPGAEEFVEGPLPASPRLEATTSRLPDGRALVVGGLREPWSLRARDLADAELLEPSSGFFRSTELPGPRAAHAAASLATGEVLVVGGEGRGYEPLSSVLLFDPRGGSVRPGPELPLPVARAAVAPLSDGGALIVGGSARDRTGPEAAAALRLVPSG